jgi:hypothetical protein
MQVLNPNEPLRTAYVNKLRSATGLPVWAKKLPKGTNPEQYILISSQPKLPTETSKNLTEAPLTANRFEWLARITVEIVSVWDIGVAKPVSNDTVEAKVLTAVYEGLEVAGWRVKSYDVIDSIDLDFDTDRQSIERKIITFQHWLCQE